MQLWPWAKAVYLVLACLIVAGVMGLSLAFGRSGKVLMSRRSPLVWHFVVLLVQLGETFFDLDTKLSLRVLDEGMASLDTLGAVCIDFESRLIQTSQSLMRFLLAFQLVPERLFNYLSRNRTS